MADKQDLQQHAERLRMTIPLMSKNGVPPTPHNYAVWYQHVAGDNQTLSQQLEDMQKCGVPFTDEVNDSLYADFASECDITRLLQIRADVQHIMDEAGSSLNTTGDSADRYGKSLEEFSDTCQKTPSMEAFGNLVATVLHETRDMQSTAEMMRLSFEEKSSEIKELQKELEQVRKQASLDSLTGLVNRATFMSAMDDAIQQTATSPEDLCLVLLDIDHFKRVNDTYGHLVGDKVIRYVADLLKKSVKGQDTAGRYGGEEYVVLLPKTPFEGALQLTESIRKSMEEAKLVRSGSREPIKQITLSAGVARYRAGESPLDLIERADKALYRSKNEGRNRVTAEGDI